MRAILFVLPILVSTVLSSAAQVGPFDDLAGEFFQKATKSARKLMTAIERAGGCGNQRDPLPGWEKQYKDYGGDIVAAEGAASMQKIQGTRQTTISRITDLHFQVADYALKMNCLNVADEEYRSVIKDLGRADDPTSRERAKVGIDDVRERRKALQGSAFDHRFSFLRQ